MQTRAETADIADHPQSDVMFMQAFYFAVQGSDEKLHEGGDFLHRTVPVLAAEGIKRERI
ncbi:hypothetical protein D3C86_2135120 [compost metagenome]